MNHDDMRINTGITIHAGELMTPDRVLEVLRAALDNAENWTVEYGPRKSHLLGEPQSTHLKSAAALSSGDT
jgi:hypothetical protein